MFTVKAERQTETGAEHSTQTLSHIQDPPQYGAVWQLTRYSHLTLFCHFPPGLLSHLSAQLPRLLTSILPIPYLADSIITHIGMKCPI